MSEIDVPHRIHCPILQLRHIGTDHGGRKQRQIFQRISMSGFGSLHAGHGTLVEAFLADFGEGGAARVSIVETAVCATADEKGAVYLREEGEDVEGRDGVDGVI